MPDGDDDDAALGARPVEDALAVEVARARIANALFATEERVRIGRYHLLQRAGAGGMGVVWSAWDPELERRVAIKLMHVKNAVAREYMLREGQSLAKLSHPNIVPIYDVGTVEEQVYLVMEWIAGVTLRAYCAEPRTTKQIVAIYLAAGAGVAAAHRAGIVQRDFKPDNVMIGDDGRVRVLDFGLARSGDSAADGHVAGTPKYMAPEQAAGGATTPAADQYSFGISLDESLTAHGREVPAWIAAIIARATAKTPGGRYADMDALLAALARDPARMWRRGAVAAALVGAAGFAFAIGAQRDDDVCTGAGDELAQVWSPARSAALLAHVRTLGPYGASRASSLADELGTYGTRWTAARKSACLAEHRNEVTEPLYERGLACLERARAALDAVTDTLARTTLEKLPDAIRAAGNLPAAERCIADATTDRVEPPPREVAARVSAIGAAATKARFLALAADPAATALAQTAAADAEAVGYPPLIARANLALGAALEMERAKPSADVYGKAADAALAGGDDVSFVEAFARRLFVVSRRADEHVSELTAALPFVTTIAKRTGASGAFARALLYNNAGTARLAVGDQAGAMAWFRNARAEISPTERSSELPVVLGNLAMVVSDQRERDALFAEERAQLERTLGADHPFTLAARMRAALSVEHPLVGSAQLREICGRYRELHPHARVAVVDCHYNLGWLAVERGDVVEAKQAYATVVATKHDVERVAIAQAELARLGGDLAAAEKQAEAIARKGEASKSWFARLPAADAWLVVAASHQASGRRADAITALQAAHRILVDVRRHSTATNVMRRYVRCIALLAIAKHDTALADEATTWYRAVGGYPDAIRVLDW